MIKAIKIADKRYPLGKGEGSDAIHRDPVYSYAVTELQDDSGITGTGLAFTLGEGNDLVCKAADFYAEQLKGKILKRSCTVLANCFYQLSNEQQFRVVGAA